MGNSPWAKPVFLSNFLKSFQNKQGNQIKQSCWANTRPLNGYTLPELNFSFMATSKARKITFFVSVVKIIPVTFADVPKPVCHTYVIIMESRRDIE